VRIAPAIQLIHAWEAPTVPISGIHRNCLDCALTDNRDKMAGLAI